VLLVFGGIFLDSFILFLPFLRTASTLLRAKKDIKLSQKFAHQKLDNLIFVSCTFCSIFCRLKKVNRKCAKVSGEKELLFLKKYGRLIIWM